MPFPETFDALKAAGYRFDNHGRCKGCGEDIEWWITPRNKKMPMNLMPEGSSKAVSHHATCEDAPLFRK